MKQLRGIGRLNCILHLVQSSLLTKLGKMNLLNQNNKVETFFDSYAIDFDSIYGEGKKRSFLTQIIDKLFRQSMYNFSTLG